MATLDEYNFFYEKLQLQIRILAHHVKQYEIIKKISSLTLRKRIVRHKTSNKSATRLTIPGSFNMCPMFLQISLMIVPEPQLLKIPHYTIRTISSPRHAI